MPIAVAVMAEFRRGAGSKAQAIHAVVDTCATHKRSKVRNWRAPHNAGRAPVTMALAL
jgi:hypothetical protein